MTAATNQRPTLQHILQTYHQRSSNAQVQQVLGQLKKCGTAQLGYHLYKCANDQCKRYKYQYHSCRNRHCPACGALQKEQWLDERRNELLPIPYYHVVFTLPHQLNAIIMGNRKILNNLLFATASQTLLSFAANPLHLGATPGILAVLHTWGQQLSFHPHLHCIVSGGGISTQKKWLFTKGEKHNFLFPIHAMAIVYRTKYLQALKQLVQAGKVCLPPGTNIAALVKICYKKPWVVYAKKPFGGPQQVMEYLGRYTHKVAITNNRIKKMDEENQTVTFDYKDYNSGGTHKQMQLDVQEFIRRFEQHILPKHFTKIRSYGYLANRNRKTRIADIIQAMNIPPHPPKVKVTWQARLAERFGIAHNRCPHCKQETLTLVAVATTAGYVQDG